MSPVIASQCFLALDVFFKDNLLTIQKADFLKLLEYASIIELGDDDELPPVVVRRFKAADKEVARAIVKLRNSEEFSSLSLIQERQIYRILRKIYEL